MASQHIVLSYRTWSLQFLNIQRRHNHVGSTKPMLWRRVFYVGFAHLESSLWGASSDVVFHEHILSVKICLTSGVSICLGNKDWCPLSRGAWIGVANILLTPETVTVIPQRSLCRRTENGAQVAGLKTKIWFPTLLRHALNIINDQRISNQRGKRYVQHDLPVYWPGVEVLWCWGYHASRGGRGAVDEVWGVPGHWVSPLQLP